MKDRQRRGGPRKGGQKGRGWTDKDRPRRDAREKRDERRARRDAEAPRLPPGGSWTWVGGFHSVEETLRAKPHTVKQVVFEHQAKDPAVAELVRRARQAGARVIFAGRRELDRFVPGGRHQGVAAQIAANAEEGLAPFLAGLSEEKKKGMVLVALDQIQDPHNLGAIARSAANLGAAGLIVPERRSAAVTPAAIQASAGAIQKIPVITVVNLGQALERLKESGFWVYGADAGGKGVWAVSFNLPLVLVIGSEGYGMRPLVRSLCHELVSIPQSAQGVESLNASCAASILLYEAARQKAAARPAA
jgi:23S rRNA (guanosine2251-2'-O)-methyltransferase